MMPFSVLPRQMRKEISMYQNLVHALQDAEDSSTSLKMPNEYISAAHSLQVD